MAKSSKAAGFSAGRKALAEKQKTKIAKRNAKEAPKAKKRGPAKGSTRKLSAHEQKKKAITQKCKDAIAKVKEQCKKKCEKAKSPAKRKEIRAACKSKILALKEKAKAQRAALTEKYKAKKASKKKSK